MPVRDELLYQGKRDTGFYNILKYNNIITIRSLDIEFFLLYV